MPRRVQLLIAAALAAALVGPVAAAPSVHEEELIRHRAEPIRQRVVPGAAQLAAGRTKSVRRVVYGYYPYWVQDLTTIRWQALTHLAWFAVEIDATGAITARHGWPDADAVAAAQAAGVRVDLTFTLFSGAGIKALCSDPDRRAAAIANMITEMEAGGADGISVDFEGLSDGTRDHFTTFIAELRAGLDAAGHPSAEISLAGPTVNWAGSDGIPEWDLDALLDHADYLFIMGYGYFWGGSGNAGPIGISWLSPIWRAVQSYSMLHTLASFSAEIEPHERRKLIHGVPYYGREWITTSDQPAAAAVDHIGAVTYAAARADLAAGRTRQWDDGIASPWYTWQQDGAWRQVWYDDEDSLAAKYQLALDQDIGGVGMWALNYDAPHAELWDLLEASFGSEPVAQPGHRNAPLSIDTFPYHHDGDTRGGPGSYFNYYACAAETPEYGRELIYRVQICQPGRLSARVADDAATDVDLHLLTSAEPGACVGRADAALEVDVEPGLYLLAVDSFVADRVPAEGAYALDVDFTAASGEPCPAPEPDPECDGGSCEPGIDDPGPGGCSCSTGADGRRAGSLLLLVTVVLALRLRRQRRQDDGNTLDP